MADVDPLDLIEDPPLCEACQLPIRYERGAHERGGQSLWIHEATGEPAGPDGHLADPGVDWYQRRSPSRQRTVR